MDGDIHIPKPGEDVPIYVVGAIAAVTVVIGVLKQAWDAGREYGKREELRHHEASKHQRPER